VGYSLGVDLGTTFVAAAVARDDGRIEMVSLGDRSVVMPSVVYVRDDGVLITGDTAARRAVSNPDRVASEVKRRLGDPTPIVLGGEALPVVDLLATLLRDVLHRVVDEQGGAPDLVVLTHPANWGPYRRELFEEVPAAAGVAQWRTLTEPEAAAAYYADTRDMAVGETIAVYDLGGGTFDATVLRRGESGIEVLGDPEGIERLGGADLDEAVLSFVNHAANGALNELDLGDPNTVVALARLRQDCVLAKEALTWDTETVIPVFLPGRHLDVRLARDQFEALIRAQVESTVGTLARTLRSARVSPDQLSTVLLVGGSAQIPLVGRMVSEQLGCPTTLDPHPKHAVALGAATAARDLLTRPGARRAPAAAVSNGHVSGSAVPRAAVEGAGRSADADTRAGGTAATSAAAAGAAAPGIAAAPAATPREPAAATAVAEARGPALRESAAPTPPAAEPATGAERGSRAVGSTTVTATRDADGGPTTAGVPDRGGDRASTTTDPTTPAGPPPPPDLHGGRRRRPGRRRLALVAALCLLLVVALVLVIVRPWSSSRPTASPSPASPASATAGPAAPAPTAPPTPPAATARPIPSLGTPIALSVKPNFVVASPDGHQLFVASASPPSVTVVDTAVNAVTATIPVPAGPPRYLAFSPSGDRLYVSVFDDARTIAALTIIDASTNTVVKTVPVTSRPYLAAVTADGSKVYVPNHDTGNVTVLDAASGTQLADIRVPPNPHSLSIVPGGRRAYIADHESNLVSVLDLTDDSVVATIPVGKSPHSVAVAPNRPMAVNVNYDAASVCFIDTDRNAVLSTVGVGQKPQAVAWSADGRFAYAVNDGSNTISVLDGTSFAVTATIPTGKSPTSIAVLPGGRTGYVSDLDDNSLTVLNLAS
jgi:YVTN family beta-propeller protein